MVRLVSKRQWSNKEVCSEAQCCVHYRTVLHKSFTAFYLERERERERKKKGIIREHSSNKSHVSVATLNGKRRCAQKKKDLEVKLLLCTYFIRSFCPVDFDTNNQQLILKEKKLNSFGEF